MSLRAKIEAIIYAAEEPVPFEQIFALAKDEAREQLTRIRESSSSATTDTQALSPEALAGIIPTEDDHEAHLAAEPVATPEPEQPLNSASALAETVLPSAGVFAETSTEEPSLEATTGEQEDQIGLDIPVATAITDAEVKSFVRATLQELIASYNAPEHGIEIRQIAGGFRMATKPEQHDAVRAFVKSLKPPVRLSLQALETLAVIAYKQPITAPEISEVRGVDCSGVLGTLLDRKLITTAGRKQVIGRPILYRTTKEFLLHFGLKDVGELPSMEEFEKLAAESLAGELFTPVATTPEHAAAQIRETEAPVADDAAPSSVISEEANPETSAVDAESTDGSEVSDAGQQPPVTADSESGSSN